MTLGGKEDTTMPNSSHPIEKSVTEKFFIGEPAISRKRTATQFQRVSPTLVQRGKRRKQGLEPGGQLLSIPKKIVEMSLEPSSQIEKTPDFHLQSNKSLHKINNLSWSCALKTNDHRIRNKGRRRQINMRFY